MWLTADHLHVKTSVQERRKLAPRYYGPYTVTEVLSDNVYRINLPKNLKTHPVINVSHLKEFKGDFASARVQHPPAPEVIDGKEHYLVEALLDRKETKRGKVSYLVKWAGYTSEWNEWRPEDDLTDDMDEGPWLQLLEDFKQRQQSAPARRSRAPA